MTLLDFTSAQAETSLDLRALVEERFDQTMNLARQLAPKITLNTPTATVNPIENIEKSQAAFTDGNLEKSIVNFNAFAGSFTSLQLISPLSLLELTLMRTSLVLLATAIGLFTHMFAGQKTSICMGRYSSFSDTVLGPFLNECPPSGLEVVSVAKTTFNLHTFALKER